MIRQDISQVIFRISSLENVLLDIANLDKLMTKTVSSYTCCVEIGILEKDMISSHN
jgi:hypothetical protein